MLGIEHKQHLITGQQRETFEREGFLVVPGALPADLVATLTEMVDDITGSFELAGFDPYAKQAFDPGRPFFFPNFLAQDQRFINLLDWPLTFPLVWGILGWNIYSYHSHFIVTRPRVTGGPRTTRFGFHRDSGRVNLEMEGSPQPRLSLKVSFWLSDASQAGRGNLYVIPGSHLLDRVSLPPEGGQPEGAVPILAAPGDAVLFDRRLYYSASPNDSSVTRKALFIGYGYRWLRPKDDMTIPSALLDKNDPVRRQLLGADTDANGKFSPKPDAVPLRNWLVSESLIEP